MSATTLDLRHKPPLLSLSTKGQPWIIFQSLPPPMTPAIPPASLPFLSGRAWGILVPTKKPPEMYQPPPLLYQKNPRQFTKKLPKMYQKNPCLYQKSPY